MSDENTVDSELDEATDTTGEVAETNAETESSTAEAEDKEAKRKATLEGQVKAAEAKLKAGTIKLEDQPKYIQDALAAKGFQVEKESKLDEESILAKLEARQVAKQLQAEVNALELTPEQRTKFESEKQELIDAGISEDKAIAKARVLAGIDEETLEAEKRGILKGRMALAPTGEIRPPKELDLSNDDDFLKWSNDAGERAKRDMPSRITR